MTGTPGKKTVHLDDLFKGGIQEGTYLQRAGVRVFKWTLWLFGGSLVLLAIYVAFATPAIPDLSLGSSAADSVVIRLLIEERGNVFDHAMRFVSVFFANIYFPLLTGILGYIFGTTPTAVETQSE